MTAIKMSVVIPYKRRLANLRLALAALANQTMDAAEFEVLIGAMEYSEDYTTACRDFIDDLNIVSIVSAQDFTIPRARNLGLRQATGQVIVQMDADTLLPPDALRNLYDRYFAFGQRVCIVGQVVGYGNNDGSVDTVAERPYRAYQEVLAELGASAGNPEDMRFQGDHVLPWAFAWTGLIALPRATVRDHELYFDESFQGWGVDDLEWGFRICASGTPIVLRPDVYALHLPHLRDAEANRETERENYRRFLRKWPRPDVELAQAFGDVAANSRYLEYVGELERVTGGGRLGTVRGRIAGREVFMVGAALHADGHLADARLASLFDRGSATEVLPLAGIATPYEDKCMDECRLLPAVDQFQPVYREAVLAEAKRVASTLIRVADDGLVGA